MLELAWWLVAAEILWWVGVVVVGRAVWRFRKEIDEIPVEYP